MIGVQFLLFGTRVKLHRDFLDKLNKVGKNFETSFGPYKAFTRRINITFILSVSVGAGIILTLSVLQFVLLETTPSPKSIFQIFLFPILTVWNFLPLLYWDQIQKLFQFWNSQLKSSIQREYSGAQRPGKPVRYFFHRFNDYCNLQMALGEFYNPYISFTLIWSLIIICFLIYFLVNVEEHFTAPPEGLELRPEDSNIWNRLIYFNMIWLIIQGLMALLHMGIILNTGRITNESVRFSTYQNPKYYSMLKRMCPFSGQHRNSGHYSKEVVIR